MITFAKYIALSCLLLVVPVRLRRDPGPGPITSRRALQHTIP